MSKKNRDVLLTLNRRQLTELSDEQSCHLTNATPHDRRMFAAGFRKGFKAGRRNERSQVRAHLRRARGRKGDGAWAEGYEHGTTYIPRSRPPKGGKPRAEAGTDFEAAHQEVTCGVERLHIGLMNLSPQERKRLGKRGRI